jgi:hypothetical protein
MSRSVNLQRWQMTYTSTTLGSSPQQCTGGDTALAKNNLNALNVALAA